MAVIHFTNYKRKQTAGTMATVMRYTMQEKKTQWAGQRLVSGVNCSAESVYKDFMTTKALHHKEGGTMFYHMVQSFPKGESVNPFTAHTAALELAKYFSDCEVLVCTHTDRAHIHSHFVINSVCLEDGKKLHIGERELAELRAHNDAVCMQLSLPVFQRGQSRQTSRRMTTAEYHTAARGQSKKLQLMNLINDCMRVAASRAQFIALMESEGCKVQWEHSRKNITYTMPSGWQCRDRMLFGDKYLKENMEHEFAKRAELIHGRTYGKKPQYAYRAGANANAAGSGASCHTAMDDAGMHGAHRATAESIGAAGSRAERVSPETLRAADALCHTAADGRAAADSEASGADGRTGWEAEREAFIASLSTSAPAISSAPGYANHAFSADGIGRVAAALAGLGYRVEQYCADAQVKDAVPPYQYTDRKLLRREKEKKIALGQKADDHEEEPVWQQTM